ncbi:Arabinan endo-1,5-alpha-L-arabinanase [Penicillium ucsense]|uniref:Arabinan endo-1,5-alpha-L-arabinanase n=1 Tax=Penicillium ucsense TaxID=2839758 RepID=A0A8J8W2T8_9EURO|nr:Arabinan endo-1,5-alpha-L-arabinanase [Penicillium ucsense]KAF7734707.1 Arabinan endo-1,5-alpha-L-arabinanase [Penicillium ucsense]
MFCKPFWASILLFACNWVYTQAEPIRVLDTDFPDPCLIQADDQYYAFATNGNGVNVQVASSADFISWQLLAGHDALPGPFPSWVGSSPAVWAPDVIQRRGGKFVMYFAATAAADTSKHCVGVAISSSVTGPYIPESQPFACPLQQGGAIDPAGFYDQGTFYVVYKVDGNSLDGDGTLHPTPLMLQALESDAITATGAPIQLLDRSNADGPLIEAPSLAKHGGIYYLTFSSNMYDTTLYDVSYAVASHLAGPYTWVQAPNAPLLVSGDGSDVGSLSGPGGSDFSADGTKIVFHAFENGQNIDNGRAMYVSRVQLSEGVIHLARETYTGRHSYS